jgi:NADH-quinone oxidoreductase subunit M
MLLKELQVLKFNVIEILLFYIQIFVACAFSANDLIEFYINFEAVMLPMGFIILYYGSQNRKSKATILFFIYTIIGSIFLLIGIILISEIGILN